MGPLISQVQIVETVGWPNTAMPAAAVSSTAYPFTLQGAFGNCMYCDVEEVKKLPVIKTLSIYERGRMVPRQIFQAQAVARRRNRNLHIQ